jgi:hypothetical protein
VARETQCKISTAKVRTQSAKSLAKCHAVAVKRGLYAINAEQKCSQKAKQQIKDLKRAYAISNEACVGLKQKFTQKSTVL